MSTKCIIDFIPVEILVKFFSYLSTKDVVKCRTVCNKWKEIIDQMVYCYQFWKRKCEHDFASVAGIAYRTCRWGMDWCDLYRSLTIWSKLTEANEEYDEFCPASNVANEIRTFSILRNGIIGVHKRSCIIYYDLETLEPVDKKPIIGDYLRYSENDDIVALHGFHLHLYIIRKAVWKPQEIGNKIYNEVKTFLLLEKYVYYVDMQDDLYRVNFSDPNMNNNFVCPCIEGIMSMGCIDDKLHILTSKREVYTLHDRKLTLSETVDSTSNLIHLLYRYNFLEMDWRIYFQWMFIFNHTIPAGPLQDIVTTKIYGNIIFVGSNWGVLRIYIQSSSLGPLDIFTVEPLKQYNFMERNDCPVLSMCPILAIEVYEIHDGHKVIVAMPKKIAILMFTHNFVKTRSAVLKHDSDFSELDEQMGSMNLIKTE